MNEVTKRPRGRPRPQETVERDNAVLALVSKQPMTRNQLHRALDMEPGTEIKVYLSLRRLRAQRLVRTCLGTGANTVWTANVTSPCP